MKRTHIIALVLIAAAIAYMLVTMSKDLTTYDTIASARQKQGQYIHLIAKLDSDEKVYCQVPFIGEDEVIRLAEAIGDGWRSASGVGQLGTKAA